MKIMDWLTEGKFGERKQEVVVSETDIEAALLHLRSIPYSNPLPKSWDRTRFLNHLREAIGQRPKVGHCYEVTVGVFAILKPFGIDFCWPDGRLPPWREEPYGQLQVWLLIRPCYTDPARITRL